MSKNSALRESSAASVGGGVPADSRRAVGAGTPGAIRHGGRKLGQDTESVLEALLGISGDKLQELRTAGAI
jgi:crotonobetainyl-CoA:carnitine CoA-transferase CaiB-like acyl-CoA transferase